MGEWQGTNCRHQQAGHWRLGWARLRERRGLSGRLCRGDVIAEEFRLRSGRREWCGEELGGHSPLELRLPGMCPSAASAPNTLLPPFHSPTPLDKVQGISHYPLSSSCQVQMFGSCFADPDFFPPSLPDVFCPPGRDPLCTCSVTDLSGKDGARGWWTMAPQCPVWVCSSSLWQGLKQGALEKLAWGAGWMTPPLQGS